LKGTFQAGGLVSRLTPLSPALLASVRQTCTEYARKFHSTGALHLLSAQIFAQLLSFGSSILVVKLLRPAELAEARIIQAYGGYLIMFGCLGFGTAIATFLPRETDQPTRMRWFRTMLLLSLSLTAVLAVGAAILSGYGKLMTDPRTAYWFRWFLLGTIANVIIALLTSYYQAERQVKKLSGIQSVVRLLNVLLIVGITWLAGFSGYVIAMILGSCLYAFSLYRANVWPRNSLNLKLGSLPTGLWSITFLAFSSIVVCALGRNLDLVIMDRLVTDRALMGSFALVASFLILPQTLTSAVQSVGLPYFAAHHREPRWLLRTAAKAQALAAFASLLVAAVVAVGCYALVTWFYGPAYFPTRQLVLPMLAAYCVTSSFHILSIALTGAGLMRVNLTVSVIVLPVSVATTYGCIRAFGVFGAAWAQLANASFYALLQHSVGWYYLLRYRVEPETQTLPQL
jgi:O-antigen/teichoic acid export membrane protein